VPPTQVKKISACVKLSENPESSQCKCGNRPKNGGKRLVFRQFSYEKVDFRPNRLRRCFLENILPAEEPDQEKTEGSRQDQDYVKCPCGGFKGELHIHPEETGHECGYHEDNRDHRQALDKRIEVIGYNRGVGFHSPTQDVGIDIGHTERLSIVDDDIFEKIGFFFILP